METRKTSSLKCQSCLFVAKDERRLALHERSHGRKGRFTCEACNYSVDDEKVMNTQLGQSKQFILLLIKV